MAEPAVAKMPNKTYSLPVGEVHLTGRITFRRKVKTQEGSIWLSILKLPAIDQFSHPDTVEVRSREALGEIGADWSGRVRVGGFPRSYDSKPDADGVIHVVKTAQVNLTAVEE